MGNEAIAGPVLDVCRFLAGLNFSSIPSHVISHAKSVLLDTLGVVVSGSKTRAVEAFIEQIPGCRLKGGGVTCPGRAGSFSPLWAALMNGVAGSSLEFEEGHSMAMGHPAVQIVPALLAETEARGLSGEDLLRGLVCGYEMASRVSQGASMRKGLHPTGTWGVVGSAVGVGCVRRREADALHQIANIAASQAFSPYVKNSFVGKNVASTFAGMANLAGMLANLFYDSGVRADEGSLAMTFSRFLSEGFDGERLTAGLGEKFAITENYLKPYPTCRFNHSALDALERILHETPLRPEEISGVRVESFKAAVHGDPGPPPNVEAMRFSTPYVIAAMIRYGSIDPTTMHDAILEDPLLNRLAQRVETVFSPEYERMRPARNPARVTLRLRDGREMVREIMNAPGDPQSPLDEKTVLAKFFSLSEPVLGGKKSRAFFNRFRNIESEKDIRSTIRLLRAAGKGTKQGQEDRDRERRGKSRNGRFRSRS
jgi:2-methylcitrate dehydratase PrpD